MGASHFMTMDISVDPTGLMFLRRLIEVESGRIVATSQVMYPFER